MSQPKTPRRRVVADIKIQADSWEELQHHLNGLATDIAMYGCLSSNSISGGCSSGHIITTNEDPSITHESWAEDNQAYVDWMVERDRVAGE